MYKKIVLLVFMLILSACTKVVTEPQTEEEWLLFHTLQVQYDEANNQLIEAKANIVEYEEVIKKNNVKIIACEAQLSNESLSLSETAKLKELKQKILFENIEIYVAIVIEKEVVSSNEQLMKNTIVRAEFKNWTLDTNH